MANIKIQKNQHPKQKPKEKLGFGKFFTDHMFIMDYTKEKGWHDPRILPYGPIPFEPSCTCLHYSQEIFEGAKAYRTNADEIQLFRPKENFRRLNKSCDRMCIPKIDEDLALEALITLIDLDRDWVPKEKGASLYLRPFIIGTDNSLGAHSSSSYKFIIIMSPSGAYYANGLSPVKILVETSYVRAVKGGTGDAKTGGNYSASLKAQDLAAEKGYEQVLWLDGVHRKYIEEVGAMNVFFYIGDKVITPKLNGSILPGITRKSVIELIKDKGITLEEKNISIDELLDYYKSGQLKEAFGSGTAAVISPIGELLYNDFPMKINNGKIGTLTQDLYDKLTGIQWGEIKDTKDWIVSVPKK